MNLSPCSPGCPFDPVPKRGPTSIASNSREQPTVLINPGAGWGAKRWPVERYADGGRGLLERGCRVLVNAGPGEETACRRHRASKPGRRHSAGSLARTADCAHPPRRLAIAGDTGPLHLACALGRPVVGIYGPTDPSRNGPFGTRFKVLRSPRAAATTPGAKPPKPAC